MNRVLPIFRVFSFCAFFMFLACEEEVPVPKPRCFPKVVFPEKKYVPFDASYCAFVFDQPAYAKIEKDTTFFEKKPTDECWFNLSVPSLNAKIHCSYSSISSKNDFEELNRDAFELAQKHNIKASYIGENPVRRPDAKVYGMVFDIEGPAASSYQFFLTDSSRHFFRGALYFETQAKPDSLAPVIHFMKQDVDRIVTSLKWE